MIQIDLRIFFKWVGSTTNQNVTGVVFSSLRKWPKEVDFFIVFVLGRFGGRLFFLLGGGGGWTSPPKTNMSPENQWLEDVYPIELAPF